MFQSPFKYNCYKNIKGTSYVTVPPDIAGWRRVTLQMAPFAERIQTVRGPCCEKAITFAAISCKPLGQTNENPYHNWTNLLS